MGRCGDGGLGRAVTLATRLLIAAGGSGGFTPSAAVMPTSWGVVKEATNPVIDVDDNPGESLEQYVPAPIRLANGDIWCYVKGNTRIYAWKSTDGGVTFALQNGGTAVLAPVLATWENTYVLEPFAIYDAATDVIHMYYKARDNGAANWQWGHATAPGATPTVFTRDPANPILTKANAQTDLGGTTNDLAISDVFMVGSTFHFHGYALVGTRYKMIGATGTTWNDPSSVTVLATAASDPAIIYKGSVFRVPGSGPAVYGMLYSFGEQDYSPLNIRAATSSDGSTWDFSSTADVLAAPGGSVWDATANYAGALLRSSTAPYTAPVIIDGTWRYYYSGYRASTGKASVGLAYLSPT